VTQPHAPDGGQILKDQGADEFPNSSTVTIEVTVWLRSCPEAFTARCASPSPRRFWRRGSPAHREEHACCVPHRNDHYQSTMA